MLTASIADALGHLRLPEGRGWVSAHYVGQLPTTWAIKLAGGSRPHQLSDLNEPSAFCTRLKTRLK